MVRIGIFGSIALLLLALVGFWPSYLSKRLVGIDTYTHFHAACGLLWLVILIVQPLALLRRRTCWHRVIGRSSWIAAALFIVSGLALAHFRFSRMDSATFQGAAPWMYLPWYAATAFAAAYALGWAFRREPRAHARFMLCTGALLIDPVLARVTGHNLPPGHDELYLTYGFVITDLAVAALLFSGGLNGAARKAAVGFMGLLLLLHLGWFTFAPTPPWRGFADWYRALPLT